jgi:hypothetical protein
LSSREERQKEIAADISGKIHQRAIAICGEDLGEIERVARALRLRYLQTNMRELSVEALIAFAEWAVSESRRKQ